MKFLRSTQTPIIITDCYQLKSLKINHQDKNFCCHCEAASVARRIITISSQFRTGSGWKIPTLGSIQRSRLPLLLCSVFTIAESLSNKFSLAKGRLQIDQLKIADCRTCDDKSNFRKQGKLALQPVQQLRHFCYFVAVT